MTKVTKKYDDKDKDRLFENDEKEILTNPELSVEVKVKS